MKFYVLLLSLCFAVGFASCGDDDDSCSLTEYTTEFDAQDTKTTAAANAYAADPMDDALCLAYSAELDATIAVYQKYTDCSLINIGGNLDTAITSNETIRDGLPCN